MINYPEIPQTQQIRFIQVEMLLCFSNRYSTSCQHTKKVPVEGSVSLNELKPSCSRLYLKIISDEGDHILCPSSFSFFFLTSCPNRVPSREILPGHTESIGENLQCLNLIYNPNSQEEEAWQRQQKKPKQAPQEDVSLPLNGETLTKEAVVSVP